MSNNTMKQVCNVCAGRGWVRGSDAPNPTHRRCNGEEVPAQLCGYCEDGYMTDRLELEWRADVGLSVLTPYSQLPQDSGNRHREWRKSA
jgi:hypothetical protein